MLEDPQKSYYAKHRVTDKDIFDNRLIFGDNLLALKALEQEFMGKIKCSFIDPPSVFTHAPSMPYKVAKPNTPFLSFAWAESRYILGKVN